MKINPVVRLMLDSDMPLTRANYLELCWPDGVPEWSAELESQVPDFLRYGHDRNLDVAQDRMIDLDDIIELSFDAFNPDEPRKDNGEWTGGAGGGGAAKNTNNAGESSGPPKFELEPKAIDVGGDDWNKKTAVRLETEYRSKKGELDKLADGFVLTDEQAEKQRQKSWAELNYYQKDMTETGWKQANFQKVKGEVDPDAIAVVLQKQWDALSDEQKYAEAKSQGSKLDLLAPAPPIVMPKRIDPLNATEGENYRQTQRLAAKMAMTRTMDLIKQRGIKDLNSTAPITESNMKAADNIIWSGWKASSTNVEGLIIQMAVADELGAHLRDETLESAGETREGLMRDCDENYGQIGGYEGFKALIRAKWETTQWLLDKAGVHDLNLYRGIDLPKIADRYDPKQWIRREGAVAKWLIDKMGDAANVMIPEQGGKSQPVKQYLPSIVRRMVDFCSDPETAPHFQDPNYFPGQLGIYAKEIQDPVLAAIKGMTAEDIMKVATADEPPQDPNDPGLTKDVADARGDVYKLMPNVTVKRNGAASTSTDPEVSNHWDGDSGRVVLRAHVPRTACVSVPAYGQNVHSEHEVVVAGSAWHGWDAWQGRAPDFEKVALGGKPVSGASKYSEREMDTVGQALALSNNSDYVSGVIKEMKPDLTPEQYGSLVDLYKTKWPKHADEDLAEETAHG